MDYRNFTELEDAPGFVLRQLEGFDTSKLRLHLKYHRRKDQEVSGYFRFEDDLVVAAVRRRQRFPLKNQWPVGSRKCRGGRGWAWVWDEEPARDPDELMVWIAAHELYHFLRHTKQVPGIQRETRANRFAFTWQRAFAAERAAAARASEGTLAPAFALALAPATVPAPAARPKRRRRRRRAADAPGQTMLFDVA